jgi:hypothetical protein
MKTTEVGQRGVAGPRARQLERNIAMLLAICVIGCFSLPEAIATMWALPLPLFANRLPYVAPLLIVLLGVLVARHSPSGRTALPISWPELFLVLNVVAWMAIELVHGLESNSLDLFREVLPHVWLFLFYYVFRLSADREETRRQLYWLILSLPVCFSLLQILSYLEFVPGSWTPLAHIVRGDRPNASNLNLSSYMAVTGMWIILFVSDGARSGRRKEGVLALLFVLFVLMVVINRTLGALLLATALISIRLYSFLGVSARWLILVLVGGGAVALAYLLMSVDLVTIGAIRSDSVRQRLGSIYIAILELSGNFHFGIGMKRSMEIRYEGMRPHTYWINVLLAYGFTGFLTFMLAITSMFQADNVKWGVRKLSGWLLMLGTMLFEANLYWWYSVIPALAVVAGRQFSDAVGDQASNDRTPYDRIRNPGLSIPNSNNG